MSWGKLPKAGKLQIYREMRRTREMEMAIRGDVKGKNSSIPLALTSVGEEAVSVGASFALLPSKDALFAGHRSKGSLVHFGVTPLEDLSSHMCKAGSPMRGRDGNIHYAFIDEDRFIGKFISHMIANWGAALGVAEGLAYKYLILEPEKHADEELPFVICFCGDGASRQGTFHEIINAAATRNLPMGFVINNNGIATDTSIEEQMAARRISDMADAYNIEGQFIANGNDVITVFNHASLLIDRARKRARENLKGSRERRAPFILECRTFRMAEHNEARAANCVDLYDFAEWGSLDPLRLYRMALLGFRNVEALKRIGDRDHAKMFACDEMEISAEELDQIDEEVKREVAEAYAKAVAMPDPQPDESLLKIYPTEVIIPKTREVEPFNAAHFRKVAGKDRADMISGNAALSKVLVQEMRRDRLIRIFGEDVGGRLIEGERRGGGVYNISHDALVHPEIGPDRVYNTPLSEIAIIGSMIGQSLVGLKPIAEIQYLTFASPSLSQIIDYWVSIYWTINRTAHGIVRLPCGGGRAAGEYHSSMRLETTFFHAPGLKMLHPSTPNDVYGLMMSAINDDSPILFFENIWGMGSVIGNVSGKPVPIGISALRKTGTDITIAAWGGKTWFDAVLPAVEKFEAEGKSAELIDVRSLAPLDLDLLAQSVKKTHRLLIVHEDIQYGGVGELIAQKVQKEVFPYLLAPVTVRGSEHCLVPQHHNLEKWFLPSAEKVLSDIHELMEWR